MDAPALLRAGEAQGAALAAAARMDIEAPLPSCPGWRMHDLVAHAGTFASQYLGRMETAATNGPWDADVPAVSERVEWFESAHRELVARFVALESLTTNHVRRWAHELSIHRWDAESAIGVAGPIDEELAGDGIEEIVEQFLRPPFWRSPRSDRTVRLEASDSGNRWVFRFDSDAASWSHDDHIDSEATVRGAASDLNLFVWGRARLEHLAITGDVAAVALLRGSAD